MLLLDGRTGWDNPVLGFCGPGVDEDCGCQISRFLDGMIPTALSFHDQVPRAFDLMWYVIKLMEFT